MSRRSNPTKQKNKARLAPSSPSGASSLAVVQPSESTSIQRELLAASLLDALTSAREVDGVFSDYGDVNKEILESASVAPSSLQPTAPLSVEEIEVPCDNAAATATAVLEPEDDEFGFDSDFGANIFADEEPASARATTYDEISCAVLQELKASESVTGDDAAKTGDNQSETWDEISLEDCCFEESPEFTQPLFKNASAYESETEDSVSADWDTAEELDVDPDADDVGEEVFEAETFGEQSQVEPLDSSPVSAIDAAIEILSQAVDTEDIHRIPPTDLIPSTDLNVQQQDFDPALPDRSNFSGSSLKSELKELTETLRNEFRQSLESMQASQAAANAAQSEVLKTLTEIMFQSAGSHDISADALEKAFSGVEERLMSRIEGMAGNAGPTQNSPAVTSPGPVATRTGNGSPMKLQNAASSVTRSWEQIKHEMMNKGELTEPSSASKPQKSAAALPEVAQLTSDRHFRLPEQDLSLEIPKAIDPEVVSDQELRNAFREREAFITTLIARIRRQQESATGQLSADQLRTLAEELPDELAEQVRHTLKQMDDLARMGELELSLERARIARQVNQLEHSRQLLERNARQMGMILNADGTIVHGPNQAGRGSGSRRWLGKLGFGQ
jgi:hypothetical protein